MLIKSDRIEDPHEERACTPREQRPVVISCDEEAWLLQSLTSLVDVVIKINQSTRNTEASSQAIRGAIHGAAVDVLRSIGLDTAYNNIKRL